MSDINFNSRIAPTQKQFDEYHKEPIDYGEDGDQLVAWSYTKEQAIEKFKQDWIDKTGEEPDFDIAGSVIEGSAGWTVEPDQYEDNDFCFVMLNSDKHSDNIVRFYKAWRLWC